ncbi:MAG: ADP-forming succinate--CoA ligase subunit beta [candidate division NC10 bacterium]|nr:ADP-forming succinate--CoA ligase subunit beta [candidate division NC10 bacterium]MBI3002770.1 ADP-forming succinate--CoA ligase subunit beta [candidate division NC10 bacterium]MBI4391972.1 ADP-forming succinate--CoA ligase subunit beta [candidate division NC10 bacterium]
MKIHEFQAKRILAAYAIPVPKGEVADTPAGARGVAERLGVPVVVKAQIHAGGRGKGGGIRPARSPAEAEQVAAQILGMLLRTPQTGPEGRRVKRVLVEEATTIRRELYLGIVLDRRAGRPVVMASAAGGMEIEEIAAKSPEKILRAPVDPAGGLPPYVGRKLAYGLGVPAELTRPTADLILGLACAYQEKDCSLAEVNPLVITEDERVLALDAKMTFDDNALFRHPEVRELRDLDEEAPLEVEASRFGLNYVKLDGSVGCMVNGAGLAMATMDIVQQAGGAPANFLDVGGGASAEQIENAFRILMADAAVRAVFINIFGGILRCDRLAAGVIQATRALKVRVPIVIRMEGTNVAEGKRMLEESGLRFLTAASMAEGARMAVAASRGRP